MMLGVQDFSRAFATGHFLYPAREVSKTFVNRSSTPVERCQPVAAS